MDAFIDRQEEIKEITEAVHNRRSQLIYAEHGMGKSVLLEHTFQMLKNEEDLFVGFLKASEVTNSIYPFIEILSYVMSDIQKNRGNLTRFKDGLREIINMREDIPLRILKASIKNIIEEKLGIADELGDIYQEIKNAQPEDLADKFVNDKKNDVLIEYIDILEKLSDKYPDKIFVFMIDQFELLNNSTALILYGTLERIKRFKNNNMCFVISYMWSPLEGTTDESIKFRDFKNKLFEKKCDIREVQGFKMDDIKELGLWYKLRLSDKQIEDISRSSGGVPLVIDEWLKNYDGKGPIPNSRNEMLYNRYETEYNSLSSIEYKNISLILSVIINGRLNIDQSRSFVEKCLSRNVNELDFINWLNDLCQAMFFRDFGSDTQWFRHELLQNYIREKKLPKAQLIKFSKLAAELW
jgi:hypothetical protein